MRNHGYNSDGEILSSAFVKKDDADPAFSLDCSNLPSLTRQEFAADADINTIMAQYEASGVISHINKTPPAHLDVTDVPDLQNAIQLIRDSEVAFMTLPAKTRLEFDNDPVKFIDYAQNPDNIEKLREWGLAEPLPVQPEPQKVEIVNPPDPVTK